MRDIYQRIWNSDRHKFLVSPRNSQGKWLDPNADILLDEQVAAFGRSDLDLATKPLFYRVNQEKLSTLPTYISLITLLDNYYFDNQKSEVTTKLERQEIEQFLEAILATEVMDIARDYLKDRLNFNFSATDFAVNLKKIWFDTYTNYFGDLVLEDASGFEHIFVGEGKYYRDRDTSDRISGGISGYHSWLKFYLDEQQQKVDYLGHNYDLQGDIGIDNPYVVSVQMLWQEKKGVAKPCRQAYRTTELFKKKGCFFVGTSPECEMAMGTVAYFESLRNYKFNRETRRTTINGAMYDLILYRNIKPDGSRGNYIRSFYPVFMGNQQ